MRRATMLAVVTLLAAACGADAATTTTASETTTTTAAATTTTAEATTTTTAAPEAEATTLTTAESDLGTVLADGEGYTLYVFLPDEQGESTCYDECEANWPPLVGEVETAGEVDQSLLGTTTRDDGSTQVTYDGWPLYYFAGDVEPGDTAGQGVGEVWYVIGPDGSVIQEMAGGEEGGDAAGPTLTAVDSDLGTVLADGEGNVLYIFLPDDQGDATCTGDCAANWPPFTGEATAGEGVDGSLIGTAQHPAEGTVTTYNGWPLYYFAGDQAPGDTNGQGVADVWFVIGPDGEPIQN